MNLDSNDLDEWRELDKRVRDGLRTLSGHAVPAFDQKRLDDVRRQAATSRRRAPMLAIGVAAAAAVLLFVILSLASRIDEEYLPAAGGTPSVFASRPPDGFRWENRDGVVVAIPTEWGNGDAPHSDYCHRDPTPTLPYIDLNYANQVPKGTCGPFPDGKQTTHVTLNPANEPAPWRPTSETWEQQQVTVGHVRITTVYKHDEADLATMIINSAHLE